jgi:hypothetical protein
MRPRTPVHLAVIGLSAIALTSALGGCERHGRYSGNPDMRDPATKVSLEAPPSDSFALAKPQPPGAVAKATSQPSAPPLSPPMLAYSYDFALEAQAGRLAALEALHEAACADAGAAVCQVTRAAVNDAGDSDVQAELELRATPAWVAAFRARLAGDAKRAGGRILSQTSGSEDLSRRIVDTEADIRAKTILRDRLEALLAGHPGKLSDLLELEQELSRVQGEIDTTQSELTVMRGRVATSAVTISYRPPGHVVEGRGGAWAPLGEAFGDFFTILASGLGFMVRAVAVLLPWGLLIGAGLWLFRKPLGAWLRRGKPKRPGPSGPGLS